MPVEQVAERIFRITVPLPDNPLKELNSYFIAGSCGNLLIDTGFRLAQCRQALLAGLRELGADLSRTDVFLTHLHSDHSGLAPEIAGPGRYIYVSREDLAWLNQPKQSGPAWESTLRTLKRQGVPEDVVRKMFRSNPAVAYAPDVKEEQYIGVKNGQKLRVGDYEFRCILTPGHTPGHMCLWEERHKIMFTGDHVLFDITPNITSWQGVEDSLGDYIQSLKQISAYDVKLALPGHRGSGDCQQRIVELLRHHQKRLEECQRAVEDAPGRTAYELAGRLTWKIHASSWEAFPATQKFFAVGECQAHLDHLVCSGCVRRTEGSDGMLRYWLA